MQKPAPSRNELAAVRSQGEQTLLSMFLPEAVGLSYKEHEWTVDARTKVLVGIATQESAGAKPNDAMAAIIYLDKLAREALLMAGHFRKDTFREEMQEGDVKYTHDVEVMKMST